MARRFGKDLENTKLCIIFSNPETVKDLIQSSRLLRSSTDPLLRKVYLNKDMTRMESEAAYQKRCQKRNGPNVVGTLSSSDHPTPLPFRK